MKIRKLGDKETKTKATMNERTASSSDKYSAVSKTHSCNYTKEPIKEKKEKCQAYIKLFMPTHATAKKYQNIAYNR